MTWPSARSASGARSGHTTSHSMRSSGWSQIGDPTASANGTAALMWSLWPWVHTTAFTVRPPTPSTIGAWSWAASTTITSWSSPTSQMLLSTSKSSPSMENVPEVTTRSIRSISDAHPSERDDRAQDLAPLHLVERLLHPVEGDGLAHEPPEVDAPAEVHVDEQWEVPGGQAVPV